MPGSLQNGDEAVAPIILTAMMKPRALAHFDALRRKHFPAERNFLPAHLTLFHHLPGPRADALIQDLKDEARHEGRMEARAIRPHFMGRGVSIIVDSLALMDFRFRLAERWSLDLVPQDRRGFRPHVTIQNKVSPDAAKALHAELSAGFRPFPFDVCGAALWWYRRGPWEPLREVRFRGRL